MQGTMAVATREKPAKKAEIETPAEVYNRVKMLKAIDDDAATRIGKNGDFYHESATKDVTPEEWKTYEDVGRANGDLPSLVTEEDWKRQNDIELAELKLKMRGFKRKRIPTGDGEMTVYTLPKRDEQAKISTIKRLAKTKGK